MNEENSARTTKTIFDNGRLEKSKRASSESIKVIITKKEKINRGDKEACTGIIRKKLYELIQFLQSCDVN